MNEYLPIDQEATSVSGRDKTILMPCPTLASFQKIYRSTNKEDQPFSRADNDNNRTLPELDPVRAVTFLEGLPDDIFVQSIWPRLWIYAPKNEVTGRAQRYLTQYEQKDNIVGMIILRSICKWWRQWVGETEDWTYGVTNYVENFIHPEEFYNTYPGSDDKIFYDTDRSPKGCY